MPDEFASLKAAIEALKTQTKDVIGKELDRFKIDVKSAGNLTGNLFSKLQDTSAKDFLGKIQAQLGGVIPTDITQKIQSLLGGVASNGMLDKAMEIFSGSKLGALTSKLTGKMNSVFSALSSDIGGPGKVNNLAQEFSSIIAESESIKNLPDDAQANMLFKEMQKGITTALTQDPSNLLAGLAPLKNRLQSSLQGFNQTAQTLGSGLDVIDSALASLPSTVSLDHGNFLSEFSGISDKIKSTLDSAVLAQSDVLKGNRFDSNNMTAMVGQIDDVIGHIGSSPNLGILKNVSGFKSLLGATKTDLKDSFTDVTKYAGIAQGFRANANALDLTSVGNPMAKQFSDKIGLFRSMFSDAKKDIDGAAGGLGSMLQEDSHVFSSDPLGIPGSSDASKVFANLKNTVRGFGKSMPGEIVRTDRVGNIAQANAMMGALPAVQNVQDIGNAMKQNLDYFKAVNPKDVLNIASPIYKPALNQSLTQMEAVAGNLTSPATNAKMASVISDTRKLNKQFDNYVANGLPKSELQSTLNTLRPNVADLTNTSAQALTDLGQIRTPVSSIMKDVASLGKEHSQELLNAVMSGNYKDLLDPTKNWSMFMTAASIMGNVAKVQSQMNAVKADATKLEHEVKSLGNQLKASGKNLETVFKNTFSQTRRAVNAGKKRADVAKNLDQLLKNVENEVKKVFKK